MLVVLRRVQSDPFVQRKDSVAVLVHDRMVAGPIISSNKPLAKGLVAEEAMKVLSDDSSEFSLRKICECMHIEAIAGEVEDKANDLPERDVREKDIEVETTEGFALAGRVRLAEIEQDEDNAHMTGNDTSFTDEELEEQEVDEMLHAISTPSSILSRLAGKSIVA